MGGGSADRPEGEGEVVVMVVVVAEVERVGLELGLLAVGEGRGRCLSAGQEAPEPATPQQSTAAPWPHGGGKDVCVCGGGEHGMLGAVFLLAFRRGDIEGEMHF